jgi:tetratricopeptide (TPR) repeat protein
MVAADMSDGGTGVPETGGDPAALRARGVGLIRSGRFDEARAVFEAVAALYRTPGGPNQLAALAFASLELACHLHGADGQADAVAAARAEAAGACDRLAATASDRRPPTAVAFVHVHRRLLLLLRDLDGGQHDRGAPDWTTALDIARRVYDRVGASDQLPPLALAYTLADLVNRIVRPKEYPYTGTWYEDDDYEDDDYEDDNREDPDEAVERAVALYGHWTPERAPGLTDLACALAERGHHLARAGRFDDAFAVFEAVVALWRLGPDTPPWQAPLAFALLQVACHLYGVDGHAEAAASARAEATAVCDRLVEAAPPGNPLAATIRWYLRIILLLRDANDHHPDDDAPDWAMALRTTQDAYSRIGYPDTSVPRAALAYVLANLARRVIAPHVATTTARDTVEHFAGLLEPMSPHDASLVRDLADELLTVAATLAERGHSEEALGATQQAAALLRWQVTTDVTAQDRFGHDNIGELVAGRTEHDDWRKLAEVLEQLSDRLEEAGSPAEAVAEQADAVAWHRKLIDWRRAMSDYHWSEESVAPPSLEELRFSLADALNNLAWQLGCLGRWTDALPAIEEAVAIDAEFGAQPDDPARANSQHIRQLTLIEVYEGLGRDADAERLRAEVATTTWR